MANHLTVTISDELDSFMYQTVGHMGIEILASAMGLPLYRRETKGKSTQTGKQYVPTDDDEVEDLYSLLETCKVRQALGEGECECEGEGEQRRRGSRSSRATTNYICKTKG